MMQPRTHTATSLSRGLRCRAVHDLRRPTECSSPDIRHEICTAGTLWHFRHHFSSMKTRSNFATSYLRRVSTIRFFTWLAQKPRASRLTGSSERKSPVATHSHPCPSWRPCRTYHVPELQRGQGEVPPRLRPHAPGEPALHTQRLRHAG